MTIYTDYSVCMISLSSTGFCSATQLPQTKPEASDMTDVDDVAWEDDVCAHSKGIVKWGVSSYDI